MNLLIRRSGHIAQDRPLWTVRWADIPELSVRIKRCLAAWQQYWQQSRRSWHCSTHTRAVRRRVCSMTDQNEDLAILSQQLRLVEQEVRREIRRRTSEGWGLGPVRFEASSGLITVGYIAFHIACFTAGIVLIALGGTPRDIGIAVVVGAIFAFGSFMAQWWAVAVQRELSIMDAADQESDAALWHDLALKRARISRQIEELNAAQLDRRSSDDPTLGEQPFGDSNANTQSSDP